MTDASHNQMIREVKGLQTLAVYIQTETKIRPKTRYTLLLKHDYFGALERPGSGAGA